MNDLFEWVILSQHFLLHTLVFEVWSEYFDYFMKFFFVLGGFEEEYDQTLLGAFPQILRLMDLLFLYKSFKLCIVWYKASYEAQAVLEALLMVLVV